MKKNILIFCVALALISLTAYGFIGSKEVETEPQELLANNVVESNILTTVKPISNIFEDFIYEIGPRFGAITKENLSKVTAFSDLIDKAHVDRIVSYKSLSVIIMEDDVRSDKRVNGNSGNLNAAQLEFLHSLDYSTSIVFWADYEERNAETGIIEDSHWTPHLTIVPEKQATYSYGIDGKDGLKRYFKDETENVRKDVDPNKLRPAKLYFTVTINGTLDNIKLDRPSGYPDVDNRMIELINNLPGNWTPAENAKGEKVEQELVVSFGLMGC